MGQDSRGQAFEPDTVVTQYSDPIQEDSLAMKLSRHFDQPIENGLTWPQACVLVPACHLTSALLIAIATKKKRKEKPSNIQKKT